MRCRVLSRFKVRLVKTSPEFGISSGVSSLVGWKWANIKQNSAKLHLFSFSTGMNKSTILSASGFTANSGIASKSSRFRKLFDSRSSWTNLKISFFKSRVLGCFLWLGTNLRISWDPIGLVRLTCDKFFVFVIWWSLSILILKLLPVPIYLPTANFPY